FLYSKRQLDCVALNDTGWVVLCFNAQLDKLCKFICPCFFSGRFIYGKHFAGLLDLDQLSGLLIRVNFYPN
ncbi:hypothetical protein KC317_g23862, partial [Hortaea werneckii]